ncbi:MAG: malate permease [Desulfonauticus sp.]|jgi:hypothetical protein|nr:MAG: Putative permease [Desulfonauticus sp. 38_4375]MDK2921781.1 malate permease [Desulfonauticus sp.]
MDSFLAILNTVLPVFLLIFLGYGLKKVGLISETFLQEGNKVIYYVFLPLLIFYKIALADFKTSFNPYLVLASYLALILCFLAFMHIPNKSPALKGTFVMSSLRGNLAYIGLSVIYQAYGDKGLLIGSVLMGFLAPLLNLISVLAFAFRKDIQVSIKHIIVKEILLNPLILASFLGIAFSLWEIKLPILIDRTIALSSGLTLPLALISIGGTFTFEKIKGNLKILVLSTGCKLFFLPLLTYLCLLLFPIEPLEKAVALILAATPTAIATYVMAQELKGDLHLARSLVMLTTLLSIFSFTLYLFLLQKYLF